MNPKERRKLIMQKFEARRMLGRRTLEESRDLGALLLEQKEAVGHGHWLEEIKEMGVSAHTVDDCIALFKGWEIVESYLSKLELSASLGFKEALVIARASDSKQQPSDENKVLCRPCRMLLIPKPNCPECAKANRPSCEAEEGATESKAQPARSGLWESAPQASLDKLPGAKTKPDYVAKLPDLVLTHVKNLTNALADFSRCYNLPANEEHLGERLKAIREWSSRVVPEAKPKPRKKPYRKRCKECNQEFTMAMKEDYTWVPLDDPAPEAFGHWQMVEDVAYYHKHSQKGFQTAHYKTCPKKKANEEPIPE